MKRPSSKHSPAPWHVEPLQWDHGASIAVVQKGDIVCVIPPLNEDDEPDMASAKRGPCDEANASLIAAAPELLAALRDLEAWDFAIVEAVRKTWGENITWRKLKEDLRNARTVIARATGGEP